MIIGDIKKITLTRSSFERMITNDNLYVDKTRMIENFLNTENDVQLVVRQRRLGKSLNMDMLRCFLTDKEDLRYLFKGLYIETSPVWDKAHSAPVFYFDLKGLRPETYREQILEQVDRHICSIINPDNLNGYLKRKYQKIIDNVDRAGDSLYFLTEIAYGVTGKRSYLLIDEYDKLLMETYKSEIYEKIRDFETALLSAGLKGNQYLEKALLTGVMRISHESMLSGLNNIVTFDVFGDKIFTDDYGLTNEEIEGLSRLANFNINEVREWYNGIRIGGHAIYNIYSVMSYLANRSFECFWGKSGTMDIITDLLNDSRIETLTRLVNGEQVETVIDDRISLRHLSGSTSDESFYSLLVQAGYFALFEKNKDKGTVLLSIPNKELQIVWKKFILNNLFTNTMSIKTLFDNVTDNELFSQDLEHFISDRLSYHDLSVYEGENAKRTKERIYHVFMLGILSAYNDVTCKYPFSNRESGDGRYDILVERHDSYYIFEFKACNEGENLDNKADEALLQIEQKRYGADLGNGKKLVKIGIAFYGKQCRVKCES